jgi:FAD/FMN-containing dehydrogenase
VNNLRDQLQARVIGQVVSKGDPSYEARRCATVWNELKPARYPRLILRAGGERDVVEAVRFARANRLRVAVRGGGHSWVGFSLLDDSLLIDLGDRKEISVDARARTARVQPAVTGGELNHELAEHNLAFPVGHCPTVPLSGFLLNGGQGWNSGVWGPASFSIEAANVVTADGDLLVASEREHSDLFWAVRGAGPGFFGVVTQYRVKLYPLPRAITTSNYFYPLASMDVVAGCAANIARQLPQAVELTMFCAPSPLPLAEACKSSNGFVATLSATAFADSTAEALAALAVLNESVRSHKSLHQTLNQSARIDDLLQLSGALWPEKHRCLADTCWSDSSPEETLAVVRNRFLCSPSQKSLAACVLTTGAMEASAKWLEGTLSMTARTLLLCYAIWERPEDDASNASWHGETIAELERFAVGHYIGESDIVADPRRAERSFAPLAWKRLTALRHKYDPDGLFHSGFGAT